MRIKWPLALLAVLGAFAVVPTGALGQTAAPERPSYPAQTPKQEALYKNPKIKKAFPFAGVMEATLSDGVARPVLPTYSDISLATQAALHPPGDIDPPKAIEKLRGNLEKAKDGKPF